MKNISSRTVVQLILLTLALMLNMFSQQALSQNELVLRDPFLASETYYSENEVMVEEQQTEIITKTKEGSLQKLTVVLKYADAQDVANRINQYQPAVLTHEGRVEADFLTNSLLIEETTDSLNRLLTWVDEIDTPQQQVQITAHIISSSREALHELGIHWGIFHPESTIQDQDTAKIGANRLNLHQPGDGHSNYLGINIAKLGGSFLEMELSALEQENQLDIIASPRLTTAHDQLASIKQGSDIPYTSQDKDKITVEFKEAVLGMEVTPQILRNKKIKLSLRISQNAPGISLSQAGSEHFSIDKQEIVTQVIVRDGETLILGGIFQQKKHNKEQKVPFLSAIPLLGVLFDHHSTGTSRRELVIFITPRLIEI